MNIGDHKGAILDAAVQKCQPKVTPCHVHAAMSSLLLVSCCTMRTSVQVAIELGTYIGYSAIRIAQSMPPGSKLYSIDPDEVHVQLAKQMVDHAGVSDKVEVIQGTLQGSTKVDLSLLRTCCH